MQAADLGLIERAEAIPLASLRRRPADRPVLRPWKSASTTFATINERSRTTTRPIEYAAKPTGGGEHSIANKPERLRTTSSNCRIPIRIERIKERGVESSLPLFVAGMMRSGTTLTETVLSGHSKIQGGGEQAFWTERGNRVHLSGRSKSRFQYDHDLVLRYAARILGDNQACGFGDPVCD